MIPELLVVFIANSVVIGLLITAIVIGIALT